MNAGWLDERGRAAADATARCGRKGLSVLIARIIASFPWECYLTYEKIASRLAKWFGRVPHRESVGRILRALANAGLVKHRRIGPGGRLPGAGTKTSSHGTTANDFLFSAMGERDPIAKRLRARLRHDIRQSAAAICWQPEAQAFPSKPRFISTAVVSKQRKSELEHVAPEIAEMAADLEEFFAEQDALADQDVYEGIKRSRVPP
jgi:hypothetical protein